MSIFRFVKDVGIINSRIFLFLVKSMENEKYFLYLFLTGSISVVDFVELLVSIVSLKTIGKKELFS